jgi:phospholipase/carboxylesterase
MLLSDLVPATDGSSRCLLVALHGLGDSMEGYRWLPEMLRCSWLNCLLVNAPDPYYGGYSWYDFASAPGPGVERSRRLLFQLLDSQRTAGYPSEQTVVFGFSQGCLMTLEVGLRYPHRFAGLIGISGYAHEPEQAIRELSPVAREQRFLLTHGTHDPLIPINPVRAQVQLLKSAGLKIEWHEFPKEHTIAGEKELAVIRNFILRQFGKE